MGSVSRRAFVAALALAAVTAAGPAPAQEVKGKLVLYTSQPERDAAQTVAAFRKVHPGVDVEVFRSGTTEVMGKLAAEFAAGSYDPGKTYFGSKLITTGIAVNTAAKSRPASWADLAKP